MPVSLRQFSQRLARSGLFSDEELSSFQEGLPADKQPSDAQGLARELILAKKLTKYQAEAVYRDRLKDLVMGDYVVLDRIGSGGMGDVFKARHRKMDRLVALKVLPARAMEAKDAVPRFYREVRAAARLIHPNIVTAFDAGEYRKTHFLVMEYVDGQDLSQIVKQHGPLTVEQAVDCTLQAARGLQCAHDQGVIHRDIKPANLLLDKQGTIKILDMGLARFAQTADDAERLTSTEQVMGTCDYMSPEQAENTHEVDHRSDIYSLGCTFYRILTGKPVYTGASPINVLMAHREGPIPSLREAREEVPEAVDAVFQKMLAKRPEHRQQSMAEVVTELEACREPADDTGDGLRRESSSNLELTSFFNQLAGGGSTGTKQRAATVSDDTTPSAPEQDTGNRQKAKVPRPKLSPEARRKRIRQITIGGGAVLCVVLLGVLIAILRDNSSPLPSEDGQGEGISEQTEQPLPAIAPFDARMARWYQYQWSKYLGVPVEWTNSIDMEMVLVPPGEFLMGTPEAELQRMLEEAKAANEKLWIENIPNEGPQHRVKITKPFALSRHEVTRGQFRRFVEETKYKTEAEQDAEGGNGHMDGKPVQGPLFVWSADPGFPQTDDHPVVHVSWNDATAFCQWLSMKQGVKYDLPTEAQWEYACRAGTTTLWCCGDSGTALKEYAWSGGTSDYRTHPVGQLKPNVWGLYDMHGNVGEWCADRYGAEYYAQSPPNDPTGSLTGRDRICRGGTWMTRPGYCRSAYRTPQWPRNRHATKGFRIVCEIPSSPADLKKFAAAIKAAKVEPPREELTERDVIEWIYRIGGIITIWEKQAGRTATFATAADVPENANNLGISLYGAQIPIIDGHLSRLQVLKEVASLALDKTRVTDEAVKHVAKLRGLLSLSLRETAVGNAGLRYLRECKTLHSIYLDGSAVSDDGMQHLAAMPWLATISLQNTVVSDQGVDVLLAGKPPVDIIWLSGTQISDAALQPLGRLPHLGRLYLSNTQITDTGLEHLRSLSTLRTLELTGTQVTEAGVARLRAARPECEVIWSPAPAPAVAPFDAETAKRHQQAWADHLGLPLKWTDSIGMKFVLIPPGEFMMGDANGEENEKPVHKVAITKPFYLGQYEVTVGQFRRFVEATTYQTEAEKFDNGWAPTQGTGWGPVSGINWRTPRFTQEDDHPVCVVSWNDIDAFCHWASQQTGSTVYLPTEAQWEYACRAGTTTRFNIGDGDSDLERAGWMNRNASLRTHPVGEKEPNAWSLYDMHGNVWDMVQDHFGKDYYAKSPAADARGSPTGNRRLIRGGGWGDKPAFCRCAKRLVIDGEATIGNGFRVVCQIPTDLAELKKFAAAVKAAKPENGQTKPEAEGGKPKVDLPPDDDDARWGPWQNLFDGKTLDGWRVIEDGAEFLKHGKVAATSGQLVLERGDPATGIVWTRDIPRVDYEISLEAMRKGGTGTMCDLVFPVKATECKLAVGGHDNADVGFELVDGSHTKIVRKMSFQDGRWYRIRLRVTDRALEAWVDDEQVLDFKPEGHVVALNPIAAPMKPFGLRTWKTGTAIRNLRLRRLKPEQSKPPTAADSVSVTLRSTLADFPDPITSLAFGPEGRKLTCNGSGGGMLAVWDTIEGKQIDSERAGQHSGDHCGRLDARLWIGALASKVTRRYG